MRRNQRGAVTAEAAMVIPVLVMVAVGLCWLVSLGVAQVRTVDAARETARALARSDPADAAIDLGRRVAPSGAQFDIDHRDGEVVVTVVAPVAGPGGLFDFPVFDAHATVVALEEGAS